MLRLELGCRITSGSVTVDVASPSVARCWVGGDEIEGDRVVYDIVPSASVEPAGAPFDMFANIFRAIVAVSNGFWLSSSIVGILVTVEDSPLDTA